MGLFDNIKKNAPHLGVAMGAVAAGAFAGETIAEELHKREQANQAHIPESTPSSSPKPTASHPNHPNHTVETITYGSNGHVVANTPDGFQTIQESDKHIHNDIGKVHESIGNVHGSVTFSSAETFHSSEVSTSHPSASAGGLFANIMKANSEIPTELKAAGLGIPDRQVQEFHTFREGGLEDGHVRLGFQQRVGWESTHNTTHTGHDEITPGANLDSESAFHANSFMGESSQGEVSANWNSDQVHSHAHGRLMIGADADAQGSVKETLNIDGVGSVGGNGNLHGHTLAGAESEGTGDVNLSRDSASVGAGGSAVAGVKASVDGDAGLSAGGNEFARVHGGAEAIAGVGVDGHFHAGIENGHIRYDMGAGAAMGVGAGYGLGGSVDAPGIVTHPGAVAHSVIPDEYNRHLDQAANLLHNPSSFVEQHTHDLVPTPKVEDIVPHVVSEPIHQAADMANHAESTVSHLAQSFGL